MLATQEDPRGAPVFIAVLKDPKADARARADAQTWLRRISSENFGDDVAAWERWWEKTRTSPGPR